MKNNILIILFTLGLLACGKQKIPSIYEGTWISIAPNGWSSTTRTLTILSSGKGHYTKQGVFSNSKSGKVKINENTLRIKSVEFSIDQSPKLIENGTYHMILSGFDFCRG